MKPESARDADRVEGFDIPERESFEAPGITITNPADWDGMAMPPRNWIIEGWIMSRTAALLAGADGVGKSLLAQQLATAIATGTPFLGLPTRETRSVYITCEDDLDELHRRQVAINAAQGVTMRGAGPRLGLCSLKGNDDNLLAAFETDGKMRVQELYGHIERAALTHGAGFVVLDNIAHLFGGNENVRGQVAAFCNLMDRLAIAIDGTVLFIGHPAKAEGSEYSGSTGWSAHVRQRFFVERAPADEGKPDHRVLRRSKANYAAVGEEISFLWHRGAFTTEDMIPRDHLPEREASNVARDSTIFLACLAKATEQRRAVSHSPSAQNFAPKAFAAMPEAKGLRVPSLKRAMETLFATDSILADVDLPWNRKNSRHAATGLGLASGRAI